MYSMTEERKQKNMKIIAYFSLTKW